MKVGDKVKCVNDYSKEYITVGQIYTIGAVRIDGLDIFITLNERPRFAYYDWRFELIVEEICDCNGNIL